jgi:hypothetical protein
MTASEAEYRLDELRIGAELGEGGAAEIHRCETADGKPMVLKRYNEEVLKVLDADALRHLIDWPEQLPVNHREQLMTMCAWPQAAVIDGGTLIGVLMDEAPTKFFFQRNDKLKPRDFTYVAAKKEDAEKRNWPYYDFPHKIARFGHLLEALQLGHSYKIVVGDLQPKNILTTSPAPDATGHVTTENFLVDCDSFIVDGRHAFPRMDPPNMRPPYDVDGESTTTDLWKFAVMMIRCLSEDHSVTGAGVEYDKFRNVLPDRDFEKLERLLREPDPGLTADDLGNLARAWQATVRPDGTLFCRTNRSVREPWTQEKRQAHLANLGAPSVPVTPSRVERPELPVEAGEPNWATTAPPATEPSPGWRPAPQPPRVNWPPPQPPPGWRPVPQLPWWRRGKVPLIGAIALLSIGGFLGYNVFFGNSDGGSQSANSGAPYNATGSDEDQIRQLVQAWTDDFNNRDLAGLQSLMCSGSVSQLPRDIFQVRDRVGPFTNSVSNINVTGDQATATVRSTWNNGSGDNGGEMFDNSYGKENGTWKICHTVNF